MSRTIKKEKTGGKRVSSHCQNNGSCNWCKGNRTIRTQKEFDRISLKLALEEDIDSSYDLMQIIYPHKLTQYFESQGMSYYEDFIDDYTQYENFIG